MVRFSISFSEGRQSAFGPKRACRRYAEPLLVTRSEELSVGVEDGGSPKERERPLMASEVRLSKGHWPAGLSLEPRREPPSRASRGGAPRARGSASPSASASA